MRCVAVSALAAQGQLPADLVELRAPLDQLVDSPGGLAHHPLDHRRVAQRAAGLDRVGRVVLDPIVRSR